MPPARCIAFHRPGRHLQQPQVHGHARRHAGRIGRAEQFRQGMREGLLLGRADLPRIAAFQVQLELRPAAARTAGQDNQPQQQDGGNRRPALSFPSPGVYAWDDPAPQA